MPLVPSHGDVVMTAFKTSKLEEAACEDRPLSDNSIARIEQKEATINTI